MCVFLYVYIVVLDSSGAAVHSPQEFISQEVNSFLKGFGVVDSISKGSDKWILFGVTFPHSKAINLL